MNIFKSIFRGTLLSILFCQISFAQSGNDIKKILTINYLGNEKTKDFIIARELTFKAGDFVNENSLDSIIQINEENVFNLGLFLDVKITFDTLAGNLTNCYIKLTERFYTIPGFSMELADRSLNEWWFLHNHQWNRFLFSFTIFQKNCRGRNETFLFSAQTGYSNFIKADYLKPYLFSSKKFGINFQFQFLSNKEIAYQIDPENNLLKYFRSTHAIRQRTKTDITLTFKKDIYQLHQFSFTFSTNKINDTICMLNPKYLYNSLNKLNYFSLIYQYQLNKTNIHFYPTSGFSFYSSIAYSYNPLLNYFNLETNAAFYQKICRKLLYASSVDLLMNITQKESYLLSSSLGYSGIFPRTFELNLIKGDKIFLFKNEIKTILLDKMYKIGFLKWKKFNTIPIRVYPKLFADIAYTADNGQFKNYKLNNIIIGGAGIGIDLVSYYDLVFRIEAGYNSIHQKTLFFHLNKAI